ncbi:MAG: MFS transporter [Ignavibacteriaceae bacterium]
MSDEVKTKDESKIESKEKSNKWLNKSVVGMGLTSFFSDASHEMATTVLPGFLSVIGAPPSALGIIEGVSDAASSFIKLWAGWISDKIGKRKLLASGGYFITGISKALFAFAATWHLVFIGRLTAWIGRGFRGPIRDAMLADSVDPAVRGKAFGFHRAGDTLGAIVGPVIGIILLEVWQPLSIDNPSQPFRNIFLITLIPGILAVLSFSLLVTDKRKDKKHDLKFWITIKELPKPFKNYLIGVGIFGMGDFAPTFLILAATTLLTPQYGIVKAAQLAGIMYVLRNIIYAAASYPIGALGDKMNKVKLLAGGYFIAVITITGFMLAFIFNITNLIYLFMLFALAGIYIAAEDTLESTITADHIESETRGIGMGVLGSVNGVGDFVASILIGFLWTAFSPIVGFAVSGITLLIGTIVLLFMGTHQVGKND